MKPILTKLLLLFIILLLFVKCNGTNQNTNLKNIENLKIAYKLEATASAKYAACAQKTREEGLDRLSVLFLSVSKANSIYAKNCKLALKKFNIEVDSIKPEFEVKTTLENLKEAIKIESNEIINIYPAFIKIAKNTEAEEVYQWIMKSENSRILFYNDAIQAIQQHFTNAFYTLYLVCPKCGNIYYPHQVDEKCSNCNTEKSKFIPIG